MCIRDRVRVFNKVGWAYGFLTDISYVADFKNDIEFMLTATMYVNSDGILNDDKYDYDSVGYPFLYQLGQTIYRYELQRDRAHKPDLSKFRIPYEQRDINAVSYTHLRAHETPEHLVCRLLLEKK